MVWVENDSRKLLWNFSKIGVFPTNLLRILLYKKWSLIGVRSLIEWTPLCLGGTCTTTIVLKMLLSALGDSIFRKKMFFKNFFGMSKTKTKPFFFKVKKNSPRKTTLDFSSNFFLTCVLGQKNVFTESV